MKSLSIRLRLTLWYSAVLGAGLALFGAGMWFALEHRLTAGLETQLLQRLEGLRTVLEVESSLKEPDILPIELAEFAREVPDGALMQLRDSNGRMVLPYDAAPALRAEFGSGEPVYRTSAQGGRAYRSLTTRVRAAGRDYDALVAVSMEDANAIIRDFRRLLFFMVPAVLLAACLGGYWISGRALSPVDEITRVARSISVQNLSRRLAVPRTGDELQRMSETWNEVLQRLDGAVKRIAEFTADASHELRSPIALIRATADLALRRERSAAEYEKALREIRDEAERVTELTESLLTMARSDANRLHLSVAPTDLNDLVANVVDSGQGRAESQGVQLKADLIEGPAVALANSVAIRRLLLALVDNALKYTPRGGMVTVATARAEGGILLSVRDTGEGIEANALPHIFERFFRVDPVRSAGSGAGLGLPIAQAIAEAHGSGISVTSAPGAGSRFELVLPAAFT